MKRHALKNIMAAAAVTVSALLVQGCDVMWGTAFDSDPYYDGGYYGDGYYGNGFYNSWWPSLSGPAWSGNWGNAFYPGNYIPPSWTPAPRPPHSRPPQWNGGGNPGPVINIGNVRPSNSGANPGGNPGPALPPPAVAALATFAAVHTLHRQQPPALHPHPFRTAFHRLFRLRPAPGTPLTFFPEFPSDNRPRYKGRFFYMPQLTFHKILYLCTL